MRGNDDIFSHRDSTEGPEWTSTHQWTNVDGWCTDRILFSIPVPSQVDIFCLPFLSPDLSFFLIELYFLPAPHPVSFFLFLFCFWNFSHPPTYYPPLFPTDLLTYIFKLKVYSSPSTYSPINFKCATLIPTHLPTPHLFFLPTNTIGRYLPNPTYLTKPTYLVGTPIDSQRSGKNKMKVLHGTLSCSLKQN